MFHIPMYLASDSYKQFHVFMYPENMDFLYSNETARSLKRLGKDVNKSVFFGLQYYLKEYLINQWNHSFFNQPWGIVERKFIRFHKYFSGMEVSADHWKKLHDLGYMPIRVKALPEGARVDARVPMLTITNTEPGFGWLVNFLETQLSIGTWDFCVNATIADMYHQLLKGYAEETGDPAFVQWQGHDFSMRGRTSMETTYNNAGHLLSFTGTDTIPAVLFLEEYYNANMENELIGGSVPATEHSVMTSYGKEEEIDAFRRMLRQFPTGIISIVSDSFDLWKVCTEYVTELKDEILTRNGKVVIRPDSGDPVDIICGARYGTSDLDGLVYHEDDLFEIEGDGDVASITKHKVGSKPLTVEQQKGVIELLWDAFGGTINEKGYKVLDTHIGAIYGDSITLDRARQICERLKAKGFATTNIVLGIGSYTYNYNTRDTLGLAVKSTWCQVNGEAREIFKDPITDDGVKKSAKGLLRVTRDGRTKDYVLEDQVSKELEATGELKTVFENGKMIKDWTLAEIRSNLGNLK